MSHTAWSLSVCLFVTWMYCTWLNWLRWHLGADLCRSKESCVPTSTQLLQTEHAMLSVMVNIWHSSAVLTRDNESNLPSIVVGDNITLQSCSEVHQKASHLTNIHGISMAEQNCIKWLYTRRTLDINTSNAFATWCCHCKRLNKIQLMFCILPVGFFIKPYCWSAGSIIVILNYHVCRFRWNKCKFCSNARRQRRAAEDATQLPYWWPRQTSHPKSARAAMHNIAQLLISNYTLPHWWRSAHAFCWLAPVL